MNENSQSNKEYKNMDEAKVIQIIHTTILRRGNGKTIPIRIVEQFWTTDGKLLAERDPCAETLLPEDGPDRIKSAIERLKENQ